MNQDHGERPTLRSHRSNFSVDSDSTLISAPLSPNYHHSGYRPISALPEEDTAYRGSDASPSNAKAQGRYSEGPQGHGLGIANVDTQTEGAIAKMYVGGKSSSNSPAVVDPLLSSPSSQPGTADLSSTEAPSKDTKESFRPNQSTPSFQTFKADSEHEMLHRNTPSSNFTVVKPSGREFECRAKREIYRPRGSWLSLIVLILAIYSSIFSGIWLIIAVVKPRYGRRISASSSLPPASASLLCAAFAKSIELSFASVFVAFLGQVLSRRAFVKKSKGITIAEMSMRAWVMQPGTILTHWENVQYAAWTLLGAIALTGALMSMLYTTASDALVTPKLMFGKTESKVVYGKVATTFANPNYIKAHCQTPITVASDPEYQGSTCVAIRHAGQAYHNYQQYLTAWSKRVAEGNVTGRPDPIGLLYDNTTITGSWINAQNMTELSASFGRVVNNISMAMPHAGVFAAARDPINGIMQPHDLNGLGEYQINASVPSPVVHILCAGMTKEELAPMVYTEWPSSGGKELNSTRWPDEYDLPAFPSWQNVTVVDDLFGFGEKYDRRHPVFAKYPIPYNTITNTSKLYTDSMYLLAASKSSYMLCSIRQSLTPNCSTSYRASLSGGALKSNCEDPEDGLAYRRSDPSATNGVLSKDWINVAFDWAMSLSLNAGITDGAASNARLLTQLIPSTDRLDPSLPSIAEALAVLAGCTLHDSAMEAPFIHYWNYSTTVPTLGSPQYQGFNATLQTQDYASGYTQRWQGIFYVVLTFVFSTNIFCLVYFIYRGGLVTDFMEPQNLFALSLNSPPNQYLEGSCGAGPEKEQFRTNWFINFERESEHFYFQECDVQPTPKKRKKRKALWEESAHSSPVAQMYSKLASKSSSWL